MCDKSKEINKFLEQSIIKDFEEMKNRKNDEGINIYHYTDINALKEILKTQKFWFTRWNYLNDMTEIDYTIRIIQSLKKNICKDMPEHKVSQFVKNIRKLMAKVYIMSFSKSKDSITMWGNYSNFQGYNIGTHSKIWNELINQNRVYAVNNLENDRNKYYIKNEIISGAVIYDEKQQLFIVSSLLKCLNDLYKQFWNKEDFLNIRNEFKEAEALIMESIIYYCALFKKPGFSPEEEFRFVIRLNDDEEESKLIKFKTYNGVFIPYIKVGIEFNEPSNESIIKLVGIGPKNKMDIAVEGLSSYLKFLGYEITDEGNVKYDTMNKKIGIFKSKIPLRY